MQRLFLLRHGQTDYNLQNRVQGGGIDAELNANGRLQANQFYEKYRGLPFRAVIHTSLQRTAQTVSQFSEMGIETVQVPALNEMNWGILEGMEASDFLKQEFHRINGEWMAGNIHLGVEKGESPIEVWNRAKLGLDQIFSRYPEGDLLICIHGRVMRIVLSQLLGYGLHNMNLFPHENTGLNLLHRSAGGKLYAEKLNDLSHLS